MDRSSVSFDLLKLSYEKGILFIELPSGRRLAYVRPRIFRNKYGKNSITYEGINSSKKWTKLETYGAKLAENITQGIARDLLLFSMRTMQNLQIVGHVYDEVIVECDKDVTVESVCRMMEKTPPWAEGLPLRADGYECEFYQKM